MKNIKTFDIKILKSKNNKISSWGYLVILKGHKKDILVNKCHAYIETIFGKPKNFLGNLYKADVKVFENSDGYTDISILNVYGTYLDE
jgi:hypothetical protein